MSKHTNDPGPCPQCNQLLVDTDQTLVDWFAAQRASDPQLHVSCGKRNRVLQEAALNGGHSNAPYGKSPHNYSPSRAIDLFWMRDGKAVWDRDGYKALRKGMPDTMQWGGEFPGPFKDAPHWQIKGWIKLVTNYPNGNE